MAEIVNLRRARKKRAKANEAAQAEANRSKHAVSSKIRKLEKARAEKEAASVDAHKLDRDKDE